MSLAPVEVDEQQDNNEELLALLALLFSITRGRWPTSNKIKGAIIDRMALKSKLEMRKLGIQFTEGAITEDQFIIGMQSLIEQGHTGAAVLWEEGPENYGPVARDIVEKNISVQDTFLAGFALAIAANQLSDVQIISRAGSYGPALRPTYFDVALSDSKQQGYDVELNVLGPPDHCHGLGNCPDETNRGWVPVGTLIPIGRRPCINQCKCQIKQMNTTTGETRFIW